ncbi:hypothetical protein V3510_005303 [Serratia marcescens]|nr:hypothetical protein [Serratia marcescens]
MTTIKRFTPDYKMHAVRFEAFAREAEHGEYVRFDAHQQAVRGLEAERDELALENAALKKIGDHLAADLNDVTEEVYPSCEQWWQIETPATDAALAAIRDAVLDRVIVKLGSMGSPDFTLMAVQALKNELREAK